MVTDEGVIYFIKDVVCNWKVVVEEIVFVMLNCMVSFGIIGVLYYTGTFFTISRNDNGEYFGLSFRGNFYMFWVLG